MLCFMLSLFARTKFAHLLEAFYQLLVGHILDRLAAQPSAAIYQIRAFGWADKQACAILLVRRAFQPAGVAERVVLGALADLLPVAQQAAAKASALVAHYLAKTACRVGENCKPRLLKDCGIPVLFSFFKIPATYGRVTS